MRATDLTRACGNLMACPAQPTPPGWIDLALSVPIMNVARAKRELAWSPRRGADDALEELLEGNATWTGRQDAAARSRVEWPISHERVPHRRRRSRSLRQRLARGAAPKALELAELIACAFSEPLDIGRHRGRSWRVSKRLPQGLLAAYADHKPLKFHQSAQGRVGEPGAVSLQATQLLAKPSGSILASIAFDTELLHDPVKTQNVLPDLRRNRFELGSVGTAAIRA